MTIGVRLPEQPFRPDELLAQLLTEFNEKRDARLQLLLDSGIEKERISIMTIQHCSECRGAGYAMHTDIRAASHIVTLTECSLCPGICVDGAPIVAGQPLPPTLDAPNARQYTRP